ncbi:MAG: WhiB family transcriptional regulator [Actinomycetota bacterium]|nr:WhiB family transcriptional regulator [Actinomycetota bacterium]
MAPEWARDEAGRDFGARRGCALFFPQRGHSANEGRALCPSWPVKSECLEAALEP